MNDCLENLDNTIENIIPEQYTPFSNSELTNLHIEFARKYLNETEETRSKYLRRIKRFLDSDLDVFSELNDATLLAFLRSKFFNFKKTCSLLKNCAEVIEKNRRYFNSIDIDTLRRVIESDIVNYLPYRDAKGRAICLAIAGNWKTELLKAKDVIFGIVLALSITTENPLNQVAGFIVILDCKGVSFSHFTELSRWFLFLAHHLQIHFHDSSNWENLHENIPPCILPEELGGYLGPVSFEHWATDIPTIRKNFFDRFQRCLEE